MAHTRSSINQPVRQRFCGQVSPQFLGAFVHAMTHRRNAFPLRAPSTTWRTPKANPPIHQRFISKSHQRPTREILSSEVPRRPRDHLTAIQRAPATPGPAECQPADCQADRRCVAPAPAIQRATCRLDGCTAEVMRASFKFAAREPRLLARLNERRLGRPRPPARDSDGPPPSQPDPEPRPAAALRHSGDRGCRAPRAVRVSAPPAVAASVQRHPAWLCVSPPAAAV